MIKMVIATIIVIMTMLAIMNLMLMLSAKMIIVIISNLEQPLGWHMQNYGGLCYRQYYYIPSSTATQCLYMSHPTNTPELHSMPPSSVEYHQLVANSVEWR